MKNFVFISPNFPTNYWKFCRQLKNNGLNVLGIGDQPYDELKAELKDSLTEYYKVNSMENYDEVHRAVAFFIHKYGRIDWLESNNEYWLVRDAQLRTDFNITTGFQAKDMEPIKYKSKMKKNFAKAGLPVARYHIATNLAAARKFMKKVGYPAVAKPDNGVGAEATYKLKCDEDLVNFFETYDKSVTYIMEEYVNATVNSYDAIIDSNGEPIFENGNVTVLSLMDVVNDHGNSIYYQQKELPEDIEDGIPPMDPAHWLRDSERRLNILHAFNDIVPDEKHPVSGNGILDLWGAVRVDIGFFYAAQLSACGQHDRALTVLEDCASLIEQAYDGFEGGIRNFHVNRTHYMPEDVPAVTCNAPDLAGVTARRGPVYGRRGMDKIPDINFFYMLQDVRAEQFHLGTIQCWDCLTKRSLPREGFLSSWLDPIRNHPRYLAVVERIREYQN